MPRDRLTFALTIGLSSVLLFAVQPIVAKSMLPKFGGSAGVWLTCMLFFQLALLAGYLYSFLLTRHLPRRAQAAVHLALIAISTLTLPWSLSTAPAPAAASPVASILLYLTTSIGMPFFLLSANSPLLQSWYAAIPGARFPYGLFAWSNLASLLALLAYPFALEPAFATGQLLRWWSVAYLALAALIALAAVAFPAGKPAESEPAGAPLRVLLWTGLSACASALWMAVANHVSQEIAAIPFLWILPLAIYLLAFILCFEGTGWYRPEIFRWLVPAALVALAWDIATRGKLGGLQVEIPTLMAALLVCCMFCDGELVRAKPESPRDLPFFYVTIAAGGALGGLFVALAAPALFTRLLELPIAVTGCALLGLRLLFRVPLRRAARLAVFSAVAVVFAARYNPSGQTIARTRNFYGALMVADTDGPVRMIYNGHTLHGIQNLTPALSRNPTAYYGPESGAGLALEALHTPSRRIGFIGLGAGTLAAYGRPGDRFRFYEINPAVVDAASRDFQFLRQSAAQTDVVIADGRLALQSEPASSFDALVLDAFSDDSIPVHLLTREAFDLYFDRLRPDGLLLVHISNRYLDLAPVVRAGAAAFGRRALFIRSNEDKAHQILDADWIVIGRDQPLLDALARRSLPAPAARSVQPWTDARSDLFHLLK